MCTQAAIIKTEVKGTGPVDSRSSENTPMEGSVQNGLPKSPLGSNEVHSWSRRVYLAYRERQYNSPHPPQHARSKIAVMPVARFPKAAGILKSLFQLVVKKDAVRKPTVVELESQQKSYGLNLAIQNGPIKSSGQEGPLLGTDSTGNVRTGLWKHETTV